MLKFKRLLLSFNSRDRYLTRSYILSDGSTFNVEFCIVPVVKRRFWYSVAFENFNYSSGKKAVLYAYIEKKDVDRVLQRVHFNREKLSFVSFKHRIKIFRWFLKAYA